MRIATQNSFWLPFSWNIIFHPLTFSLYVSPGLILVSCRQNTHVSCFCIHSTDCEESWALKNWCFWTMVLKTLDNLLDCKEIQPVHPKGDQSWMFIGRTDAEAETPILWPPDVKSWFIWKDPDPGRDWGQEEKGTTEDEVAWWHHRLDGHEVE